MSTSKSHFTASQAATPVAAVPLPRAEESRAKHGFVTEAMTKAAGGPLSDPETKRLMIAEAAYYCAEKRGIAPGGELQDWLDAEARATALLR